MSDSHKLLLACVFVGAVLTVGGIVGKYFMQPTQAEQAPKPVVRSVDTLKNCIVFKNGCDTRVVAYDKIQSLEHDTGSVELHTAKYTVYIDEEYADKIIAAYVAWCESRTYK